MVRFEFCKLNVDMVTMLLCLMIVLVVPLSNLGILQLKQDFNLIRNIGIGINNLGILEFK